MKMFRVVLLVSALSLYAVPAQANFWEKASAFLSATQSTQQEKNLAGLSVADMDAGLREALSVASSRVVSQLGVTGGFAKDPKIKIPLPVTLQRVDTMLKTVGMNHLTQDLEQKINAAAEKATPQAKQIFVNAIKKMTLADAKQILTGPNNAATEYLRKTMQPEMVTALQPLVGNAMAEAGAVKAYDQAMGQYQKMPYMPDVKANLHSYVTQKTIDGIFYYVAQEEAAIRKDPAKRTTALLKKVFSAAK